MAENRPVMCIGTLRWRMCYSTRKASLNFATLEVLLPRYVGCTREKYLKIDKENRDSIRENME